MPDPGPSRIDVDGRVLTDPRAIRALAHPARLTVLEILGEDEELTATSLAALTDITPSAMSYHLRALEKWGFVQRAESADGRERPWRRVVTNWSVKAMPDAATAAATSAVTRVSLQRAADDLERWFAREREQPDDWRDAAILDNRHMWLTVDEANELQSLYDDFLATRKSRTTADHPAGARRVRLMRVVAPTQFD